MDAQGEGSSHAHERRLPQRGWLLLAAVAVAGVGGLGYWALRGPVEQANFPEIVTTEALLPACEGGRGTAFTAFPEYRGSAPHPVIVVAFHDSDGRAVLEQSSGTSFPRWGLDPLHPQQAQIVACMRRVSADQAPSKSCVLQADRSGALGLGDSLGLNGSNPPVETATFSLHHARWEITLRELRTHREIAHATLSGDDVTCPASASRPANINNLPDSLREEYTRLYSWPTAAQWETAFARYVTGPAT